jgi:23S rRNA (cytosine1962-C5)-methyltransferase
LDWGDYALLDSGQGSKLERFGEFVLERPSPQSLWLPRLESAQWKRAAAKYHRSSEGGGEWESSRPLPDEWWIGMGGLELRMQATGFGHVGIFAEQLPFWHWITRQCADAGRRLEVLNLFAYTGGSSLAAAKGGARVTHCDASRGIVQWASENAQANGLGEGSADGAEIRWIVDDAWKFVGRESRRGHRYDAIILDPPSFGRGPKGQVWKLERDLTGFLAGLRELLSPQPAFLLLSAHTPGVGAVALRNLLGDAVNGLPGACEAGEMVIPEGDGARQLPSGTWATWSADGAPPPRP